MGAATSCLKKQSTVKLLLLPKKYYKRSIIIVQLFIINIIFKNILMLILNVTCWWNFITCLGSEMSFHVAAE